MPCDHGGCVEPVVSCHVIMGNICACCIMPSDHGECIDPAVSCHVIMGNILSILILCKHVGQERLLSPRLHRMTSRIITATQVSLGLRVGLYLEMRWWSLYVNG